VSDRSISFHLFTRAFTLLPVRLQCFLDTGEHKDTMVLFTLSALLCGFLNA